MHLISRGISLKEEGEIRCHVFTYIKDFRDRPKPPENKAFSEFFFRNFLKNKKTKTIKTLGVWPAGSLSGRWPETPKTKRMIKKKPGWT